MKMKKIILIILIGLIFTGCASKSDKKAEILNYTISEKQDISYINTPRMVYRIVLDIDSIPAEENMRNTAISIWEDGNKNWKEFSTFFYLPEMNTGLMAYGIGEFNQAGLVEFKTDENALYGTKWEIKKPEVIMEEIPISEKKDYSITIVPALSGRELKIGIKTDFPDGTILYVDVHRIHFLKGSNEEYAGEIFERDFVVNQGSIETTVQIDDSDWYNEHLQLVKDLPNDIQPISKISENITVSVMFSPKRDQPANILMILGTDGEYVGGVGAENDLGFTVYRVSKEVKIPLQK